MRYTTIIDISEIGILYNNINCRLLYLHLCLKSGFHDFDRDLYKNSLRGLANDVGITLSACRNSIKMLKECGLLTISEGVFEVKKFVLTESITKRERTRKGKEQKEAALERQRIEEAYAEEEREREAANAELRAQGKTPFMQYYETLLVKASGGDENARVLVKRHKATYEAHKVEIENELNND